MLILNFRLYCIQPLFESNLIFKFCLLNLFSLNFRQNALSLIIDDLLLLLWLEFESILGCDITHMASFTYYACQWQYRNIPLLAISHPIILNLDSFFTRSCYLGSKRKNFSENYFVVFVRLIDIDGIWLWSGLGVLGSLTY